MEDMNQLKMFTVEEANKLLPKLTELIHEAQKSRDQILRLEVEVDALELVADKDENGFSRSLNPKIDEYNRTVGGFYSLLDKIQGMGCFLKDVNLGLVDFYSLQEGRVVYLCWKAGEPEIGFWHEIGRGYASRQPLRRAGNPESS